MKSRQASGVEEVVLHTDIYVWGGVIDDSRGFRTSSSVDCGWIHTHVEAHDTIHHMLLLRLLNVFLLLHLFFFPNHSTSNTC